MQLIELQCFMPSVVWAGLVENTYIKYDIYERYEKMSFRNTYTLVGANGPVRLSIPLVNGRNQRVSFSEVKIDYSQSWQKLHWKTILSAYNRSPWFEFYQLELKQLYEQSFEHLVDFNSAAQKWLLKQLKWKGEWELLRQPFSVVEINGQTECHDLRNVFAPRNIQQLIPEVAKYNQVFEDRIGFVPYTSILDLLFCEGPNAKNILQSQRLLIEDRWKQLGRIIQQNDIS